jgi:hypothetical protein
MIRRMIKLDLLVGVVTFALWVYCLVSVIQTPSAAVRNLPKLAWVVLVLFFPLVGSLAWLVAGRPDTRPRRLSSYERAQPTFPEYDRPGRLAAAAPEQDDAFLQQVRERAEAQRKAYDDERRREAGESS